MTKLEREIYIDASPEDVYDELMDPDCLGSWVTIQDSVEAPDGDLEKGDELVQRVKVAGQQFKLHWRSSRRSRGTKAVWNGKGPLGSKAKAIYELARTTAAARSPTRTSTTYRAARRASSPAARWWRLGQGGRQVARAAEEFCREGE